MIKKLFTFAVCMILVFVVFLFTSCPGPALFGNNPDVKRDSFSISIIEITPAENTPIGEDTIIDADLTYMISDHTPGQYLISIYFKTTTGGHVITGSDATVDIVDTSSDVCLIYQVDSMDVENKVVCKPYQICYCLLEKGTDCDYIRATSEYKTYIDKE